jgi:hypothetical protein
MLPIDEEESVPDFDAPETSYEALSGVDLPARRWPGRSIHEGTLERADVLLVFYPREVF